jgi:hypothetical protein
MRTALRRFRPLRRLLADRRGSAIVETGFLMLGSLVIFLVFIVLWPLAFMRMERTEETIAFTAEVLARENVWTDAMLTDLARIAGSRMDPAETVAERARTVVTIHAARIYRNAAGRQVALPCRSARYTAATDVAEILPSEPRPQDRAAIAGVADAAIMDTSYLHIVEYRGELRIWMFTYVFTKSATARPVNGVISIQPAGAAVPRLCA